MSAPSVSEREKYQACWADPRYREHSPGEAALPLFRQMVPRKQRVGTLVDLGCGTGRAGLALNEAGFEVTLMDLVPDALDPGPREALPFIERNLCGWWPPGEHWAWGYCCDVMEHLPPVQVFPVLERIARHCERIFFTIHFGPDHFGKVVGHPLHLSVHPFSWWHGALVTYGVLEEARDLMGMGAFLLRSHA